MLRVRFHGRGGQGMKTASRILGSAAFRAGFVVQDSPVYGAERRGAPMSAFTRIAREPILERGVIDRPDLVAVSDDSLLTEPTASPLAGCDDECTLLVNSTLDENALRQMVGHGGPILAADFTALALERTYAVAGLSTALGVAAAGLVGLTSEDSLAGVEEELGDAHLSPAQLDRNAALARDVYKLVRSCPRLEERERSEVVLPTPLADVTFDPPRCAAPSIYAAANTAERKTGSWRQFRPVLDLDQCSRCWLCFVWCPDGAISLDDEDRPLLDYDLCKGCLLCAQECPTHAFHIEKESR
ncbi:MAG: 2-oxoacid:acceptor oxidoreductase family protein [Acidobacteriota bacterium]